MTAFVHPGGRFPIPPGWVVSSQREVASRDTLTLQPARLSVGGPERAVEPLAGAPDRKTPDRRGP